MMRAAVRRGLRLLLKLPGAAPLRGAAARLPFSRFHGLVRWVCAGTEVLAWRGVRISIECGELHGYYVYVLGDYATEEIDKAIELCAGARTFADVGANIGLISLAVARACPHLTVLAFEPDREVAARFSANLALNPDLAQRVHLVECAVAARAGTVTFVPSDEPSNAGAGRVYPDPRPGAGYSVRAVTLGDCFDPGTGPHVVKIDVEGGELDVLAGLWSAPKKPRAILLETHAFYFGAGGDGFNRSIVSELDRAGYSLQRLTQDGWSALADPRDLGGRSHLLALPRS